ncbi:hypothetical protein AVEN_240662-1 [Araneus ventricosus]|uniref:CCHC-type domain-containing protein n=1 Tax=Araneus ventricosus TaxID=182803 RepID=A0A4Y2D6C7_ARAVE|nr:hypothetical protein AVEN_240662-1 [Araneus ventricosus]
MTRYQAIDTPGTNIANIRPRGRHARPTRGDFAVHEKQEANRVVTASHGEFLACRREQEAKKRKVEAEGEGKPEGRPDQKGELKVNVSVHRNLNFSRGVIFELGLKKHTESELVEELSEQKVCAARRISMKRDGKLIPTQHVILTFSTTELPRSIKAGYLSCPVEQYISNPVGCFKCQIFGHSQQACKGSKICAKCSISGQDSADCISDDAKFRNCQGPHPAFSRSCPQWALEKRF